MLKRSISEKQRLANIANAQKSTGPNTIRGKSISRRNALKGGLSGEGTCLPDDFRADVDREIAIFSNRLKPADPFEQRLIERAALASVRLNRINTQRELDLDQRRRQAIPLWDQGRADDVERLLGLMATDPASAVRDLTRFTEGCDALADIWDDLKTRLETSEQWLDDHLDRALRLLGEPERPGPSAPERVVTMTMMALVLNPEPDLKGLFALLNTPAVLDADELNAMIDQARTALVEFIDEEIKTLRTLGDQLWTTLDQPDRESAPNRCLIDVSDEGVRLNRLEADADRQMQRSLKQLETVRREARQVERAQNEAILTARKLERLASKRVTLPPRNAQADPFSIQEPPMPYQAPPPPRLPSRYPPNGGF
ncbi:MAG: hypothetical protein ABI353_07790 [Isosphaeraceae bacterium]